MWLYEELKNEPNNLLLFVTSNSARKLIKKLLIKALAKSSKQYASTFYPFLESLS